MTDAESKLPDLPSAREIVTEAIRAVEYCAEGVGLTPPQFLAALLVFGAIVWGASKIIRARKGVE